MLQIIYHCVTFEASCNFQYVLNLNSEVPIHGFGLVIKVQPDAVKLAPLWNHCYLSEVSLASQNDTFTFRESLTFNCFGFSQFQTNVLTSNLKPKLGDPT